MPELYATGQAAPRGGIIPFPRQGGTSAEPALSLPKGSGVLRERLGGGRNWPPGFTLARPVAHIVPVAFREHPLGGGRNWPPGFTLARPVAHIVPVAFREHPRIDTCAALRTARRSAGERRGL